MKKELYEAIELDVIYLKSMDAIASSPNGDTDEDELEPMPVGDMFNVF